MTECSTVAASTPPDTAEDLSQGHGMEARCSHLTNSTRPSGSQALLDEPTFDVRPMSYLRRQARIAAFRGFKEDLELIPELAESERARTARRWLVLASYEDGTDTVTLRAANRLMPEYQHQTSRRFLRLSARRDTYAITLTTRTQSPFEALTFLEESWNRFMLYLRRGVRQRAGGGSVQVIDPHPDAGFFKSCELGQRNYMAHIHSILYGVGVLTKGEVQYLWSIATNGTAWQTDCHADASTAHSYFQKYICKGLEDTTSWAFTQAALFWACGKRQWSVSQGLLAAKRHSLHKYLVHVGTFDTAFVWGPNGPRASRIEASRGEDRPPEISDGEWSARFAGLLLDCEKS